MSTHDLVGSDSYEKPSRWAIRRFRIWLHMIWNGLPYTARRVFFLSFWVIIIEITTIAFLAGISYLVAVNILQLPVVVSFGVVELLAFLLAKYFLRERNQKHSVMEYMAVADNLNKYAHLVVHYADTGVREDYPEAALYLLNEATNHAFWVPNYLDELTRVGAIRTVEHDTEDELYRFLKTNKTTITKGFPRGNDLRSTL